MCRNDFYIEMHWLQFSWPIPIFFLGSLTFRYRFLQIPIFFLRTIIDSIYKQISMQISTKNYLHNKIHYYKFQFPQSGLIYRFSLTKHRCVLLGDTQQFCCGFDRNYFRHLISTSCLLKYYCIKSVSHCNRADIVIQEKHHGRLMLLNYIFCKILNILFIFLPQYASIHFWELLCVCGLSHTLTQAVQASSGTT